MTTSVTFPASTHLFSMKGKDARDFLNRLTTVNLNRLNDGDLKPGFLLNAQGKIRAAFRIAGVSEDSFWLEVDGGANSRWKEEFLKVLDQMTFAEKYELTEMTGLKNAWVFGVAGTSEEHAEKVGELILLHGSRQAYDREWTSVWGPAAAVDAWIAGKNAKPMSENELDAIRVRALRPKVDQELVLEANPLEIGLREGIADNKGCYPGQEVIEKIISLGSPAKRLALLTGSASPASPKIGDKVLTAENQEVGTVTSLSLENGRFSALAVLRKNVLEEGKKLRIGPNPETTAEATIERIARYE